MVTVSGDTLCCLWRRCNDTASRPRTSPPSSNAKTASRHAFRRPRGATQCLALLQMIEIVSMIYIVRIVLLPDNLGRFTAPVARQGAVGPHACFDRICTLMSHAVRARSYQWVFSWYTGVLSSISTCLYLPSQSQAQGGAWYTCNEGLNLICTY